MNGNSPSSSSSSSSPQDMDSSHPQEMRWDQNALKHVQYKQRQGVQLTWQERLLLNWWKFSGYPRLRSEVVLFEDEKQFNQLLMTGKPVIVAFTTSYHKMSENLKRQFRLCAPYYKDTAIFLEVDCGLTPDFCKKANFPGEPAIDVFHLSHKNRAEQRERFQQRVQDGDLPASSKLNFVPKLYRFDYSWTRYGFQKFFEDYGLMEMRTVWKDVHESFTQDKERYYRTRDGKQGQA